MILTDYSGARGPLIREKKLRSKISCQTTFNDWFICLPSDSTAAEETRIGPRTVADIDWQLHLLLTESKIKCITIKYLIILILICFSFTTTSHPQMQIQNVREENVQ
jgi:hypothetical protein